MWVTMGPIADRTNECLGASDLAIVEFRKRMLDALKEFQGNGQAIGTGDSTVGKSVCSFQAVVPNTIDWRSYTASYVWNQDNDGSELEPSYNVTSR